MTDTLSESEIAYIVEWAESGNEPRMFNGYEGWPLMAADITDEVVGYGAATWLEKEGGYAKRFLNKAGLTIAKLARENRELEKRWKK